MADENHHNMHPPKARYEVNVNTAIQIVGFLVLIAGGGATWGTTVASLNLVRETQIGHMQRTATLEAEQRKYDNLAYRVTVQEQGAASLARSVEELKAAVSNQGTDLRVIREILTRLDQQISRNNPR